MQISDKCLTMIVTFNIRKFLTYHNYFALFIVTLLFIIDKKNVDNKLRFYNQLGLIFIMIMHIILYNKRFKNEHPEYMRITLKTDLFDK